MASKFIQFKNVKIALTDSGKGRVVVLLHGFLENKSMWNTISAKLIKKYRVVCIDLLGHGESESHGYIHSMEEQAEMVKTVLNHLRLRKYVLIGHSMGGYISLAFAKQFSNNLKGLCLMNSSALPDSKEKIIHRNRAIEAVKQNHKTFVRIAVPMLFSEKNRMLLKNEIQEVTNEAIKMQPQGITAALEGMKIRKNNVSILKSDAFPIQMIIGKEDPALEYNSLIKQVKNTAVQTVEFPDGHMSHIENRDDLILSFKKFLNLCFK
jgi:pimeloyl-ACP methyl ester carboxylesterase